MNAATVSMSHWRLKEMVAENSDLSYKNYNLKYTKIEWKCISINVYLMLLPLIFNVNGNNI